MCNIHPGIAHQLTIESDFPGFRNVRPGVGGRGRYRIGRLKIHGRDLWFEERFELSSRFGARESKGAYRGDGPYYL